MIELILWLVIGAIATSGVISFIRYLLRPGWKYDAARDCAGGEHGFFADIKVPSVIRRDGKLVRVHLCMTCARRLAHDLRFQPLWSSQ